MEKSVFGTHLVKVRNDVITALQQVHPKGMPASSLKAVCSRAKSIDEILGVLAVMVKNGDAARSSDKTPVYWLLDATKIAVDDDTSKAPAPVKTNPSFLDSRGKHLRDRVMDYLGEHGPTLGSVLRAVFGASVYTTLSALQREKRIHCVGTRGRAKIMAICDPVDASSTAPSQKAAGVVDEPQVSVLGHLSLCDEQPAELASADEFDKQASRMRVAQIVEAIESRARLGTSIPIEWPEELKQRLAHLFTTNRLPFSQRKASHE